MFCFVALLQSCYNRYILSTDDLQKELRKVKDTSVAYKHKYYDALVYTHLFNNGLSQITCYDKNGKPHVIEVYSNTVAIISKKDTDVLRLLFSTMFIKDSLLYGQLTFPSTQVKLNFKDIKAIKIKSPKYPPAEWMERRSIKVEIKTEVEQ